MDPSSAIGDSGVQSQRWNMRAAKCFIKVLFVLWASPATILGLLAGGLAIALGGRARLRHGALEFYGRPVHRMFQWLPPSRMASAMTLGHVILGVSAEELERASAHERIHVRQYELWGPFFIPAYLLASAWLWLRGKNPYWDNPFEKEAYRRS